MPAEIPSAFGFALTCLRSARGWTQTRLALAAGIAKSLVSRYENGSGLIRETLDWLLGILGYPREAADPLIFAHRLIFPDPLEDAASPLALTPEERQDIDRACLATGLLAAEEMRAELIRKKKVEKAAAKRREAEELWERLKAAASDAERRDLVVDLPDFRSWALAVRVCDASVRAAAHKPKNARELAALALFIAERVAEPEAFRSRLLGYCWAHIGNSCRVSEDYDGADEALARAWNLWRTGADSQLLPEWLLFTIEASLRRARRQFSDALSLLDQAMESCGGNSKAACLILLEQVHVFNQIEDFEGALAVLEKAAPFVEASEDPHLHFTFLSKRAINLYYLERHTEAAALLPRVREMAIEQRNELNLIRVVWLQAKVNAAQGRTEEATDGLQKVRGEFTARDLPYDAALVSLDLAVLLAEGGSHERGTRAGAGHGLDLRGKEDRPRSSRGALPVLRGRPPGERHGGTHAPRHR